MENKIIKLNVKLRAYTKGIIPNSKEFIKDAPNDGKTYVRQDGEWKEITNSFKANEVIIEDNSGLIKESAEDTYQIKIKLNEWYGTQDELPEKLDANTKYYIIDQQPDLILCGGTAYSDENEEYDDSWSYGNAFTKNNDFDIVCIPMNAKGEFIYE